MANIINGTDTGSGGLITTGDSSDELQLQTAETARVTLTNTAVVVNEGGNDVDFRVEGDTDANLLFVDASADKVGIGTSSPSSEGKITVGSTTVTDKNGIVLNRGVVGSVSTTQVGIFNENNGIGSGESLTLRAPSGYKFQNYDGTTEFARIDSSGNLLVGTTSSPNYSSKLRVQGGIETQGANQFNIVGTSATPFEWVLRVGSAMDFYVNDATVVATLSSAGVWTDASDARYKENIEDSEYGLAEVMQLTPRTYNIIGDTKKQVGFIAQEVIDVIPEVVDSVTNSVTNEDRYTLSYGQMTAVLTKAIQELKAELDTVKAELATLKGQ